MCYPPLMIFPNEIRVVAHVTARPDQIEELKTIALALAVRQEAGCRKDEWHQNTAALDDHLASPHARAALKRVPELSTNVDIRRYKFLG
jgi:quinol monooxygenase YgiN